MITKEIPFKTCRGEYRSDSFGMGPITVCTPFTEYHEDGVPDLMLLLSWDHVGFIPTPDSYDGRKK